MHSGFGGGLGFDEMAYVRRFDLRQVPVFMDGIPI
jgi:hypothetical protein